MAVPQRKTYKELADATLSEQEGVLYSKYGFVDPYAFDSLRPLPRASAYTFDYIFYKPKDDLETHKDDFVLLAHACGISPHQNPEWRPWDLAWTIASLSHDDAKKLGDRKAVAVMEGDHYVRMRTGSFSDFAKLAYAFSPDNVADQNQSLAYRVSRTWGGVEVVDTTWAQAACRSLDAAGVPFTHSSETDGTQRFQIAGPHRRPGLILQGMLNSGVFGKIFMPSTPVPLEPRFARLPDNFGAVTLERLEEARRKGRGGFLSSLLGRTPKVETYRNV